MIGGNYGKNPYGTRRFDGVYFRRDRRHLPVLLVHQLPFRAYLVGRDGHPDGFWRVVAPRNHHVFGRRHLGLDWQKEVRIPFFFFFLRGDARETVIITQIILIITFTEVFHNAN